MQGAEPRLQASSCVLPPFDRGTDSRWARLRTWRRHCVGDLGNLPTHYLLPRSVPSLRLPLRRLRLDERNLPFSCRHSQHNSHVRLLIALDAIGSARVRRKQDWAAEAKIALVHNPILQRRSGAQMCNYGCLVRGPGGVDIARVGTRKVIDPELCLQVLVVAKATQTRG